MTLNGVMAVTLRYFTEFGKPVFQHITASICGGIHARVYCILHCAACTMFAISSADAFLELFRLYVTSLFRSTHVLENWGNFSVSKIIITITVVRDYDGLM